MNVRMVLAMGENREIGTSGSLLWDLPDDLKHFKEKTLGKPVIMGRKTFQSIGKPLPGRTNIIVTRNEYFEEATSRVVHSLEEAFQEALQENPEEICVIGGGEICTLALPYTSHLSLTFVDGSFAEADVFFPVIDESDWKEASREHHVPDQKHKYSFTFIGFERMTPVQPLPILGTANTEYVPQSEESQEESIPEKVESTETEVAEDIPEKENSPSSPLAEESEENTSQNEEPPVSEEVILEEIVPEENTESPPSEKIETESEKKVPANSEEIGADDLSSLF